MLGSQAAWAISTGCPDVIVAVIDTGVDASHPDLAGRVIEGWNLWTQSTDTSPTSWHGTAVAGVIAAVRDNGRGVAGLADVSILPVVPSVGETINSAQAAAAIRWAADHGARVINISASVRHQDSLRGAVQYAWDRGSLVVMATGNSGGPAGHPAWDELILVSSSDPNDEGYRSEHGNALDLLAPGVDIYTTYAEPGREGEDRYAKCWGASFAAPMVSSAAAIAWSINPDLTPAEVRDLLFATAVDLGVPGWDAETGHGRLDLAAAARAAYATVPEPTGAGCLAVLLAAWLVRGRRGAAGAYRAPAPR
jgi:subtilisin family serine protease